MVVPLGFEPRSEEPESSMMDRYTKGLWSCESRRLLQFSGLKRGSDGGESKQNLGDPGQHHDDHERSQRILRPRPSRFGFGPQIHTHGLGLGDQFGQLGEVFLHRIMSHARGSSPFYLNPTLPKNPKHRLHKALKGRWLRHMHE